MPSWLDRLVPRRARESGRNRRRLAAMSAAVAAYLEAERTTGRGAPVGLRARGARGPWVDPAATSGLNWAQVGRLEAMFAAQQFGLRKGNSRR